MKNLLNRSWQSLAINFAYMYVLSVLENIPSTDEVMAFYLSNGKLAITIVMYRLMSFFSHHLHRRKFWVLPGLNLSHY